MTESDEWAKLKDKLEKTESEGLLVLLDFQYGDLEDYYDSTITIEDFLKAIQSELDERKQGETAMSSVEIPKFPGNSRKEREAEQDEPKKSIKPVIQGRIVKRKKPLYARFGEAIFGEDTRNVGAYILWDVLVPAAKNTITDMISNGIEMLVYGETKGGGRDRGRIRRDGGRSYTSYGNYYKGDRDRDRDSRREPEPQAHTKSRHAWEELVLDNRSDAEQVLSNMVDLIEQFEVVSVSDLCELIDQDPEWTDNKYGWTNLSKASVERVREGWLVNLPRPYPI
jgi:hypothetical protein